MKKKICPKCKSSNVDIAAARWRGDIRFKCLDCDFEGETFLEEESD